MRLYYSGIAVADLLGEVRHAYCRTCEWQGAEGDHQGACRELIEHRREHAEAMA